MNMDMHSETSAWKTFFAEFDGLFHQHTAQVEKPYIDLAEAQTFFQTFSHKHTQFLESGGAINVWEVAGIGHNEVRNCAVLEWLLDYYGSHGQKGLFLQAFLNCLHEASNGKTNFAVQGPYRTRLEDCYDQGESRVDITIENDALLLFIEAKIYADETGNQLKRYKEILASRSAHMQKGLVFLTPSGYAPKDSEDAKDLILLSWHDIAHAFERIAKKANNDGQARQPYWIPLVQQFCWHIRQF